MVQYSPDVLPWSTCYNIMVVCRSTLYSVSKTTLNRELCHCCIDLLQCMDMCMQLCMCIVSEVGRTTNPQQELMRCCTRRLETMVECCGNVIRVCSDRAMRANGPLAKHILGGGGRFGDADSEMADSEVVSQLYKMFIDQSDDGSIDSNKGSASVNQKHNNETNRTNAGGDLTNTRINTRSKSVDSGVRLLVNAFMKALPNIVIATGDHNSIRTGERSSCKDQPASLPAAHNAMQRPVGLSLNLFEALLSDIKRLEDAALDCIDRGASSSK